MELLQYKQRDYGYYVSNDRGHATIIVLLGSYYVIAVIHGHTYTSEFKNAEDTRKALTELYEDSPKAYSTFKKSRRATSLGSRIYRWLYEFMQC